MRKCLAVALVAVFSAFPAFAKDKQSNLPAFVLRATSVMVVIDSNGIALDKPGGDQAARTEVEHALQRWGRFKVVWYASEIDPPDLIIDIRTGGTVRPTLTGRSPNDRGTTIDSDGPSVTIGTTRGTPPPWTSTPQSGGRRPGLATEVSSADDTFAVYDGRLTDPLDHPAIWRYSGKSALAPPTVRAVQEFKKAIDAAEKAQAGNKKP